MKLPIYSQENIKVIPQTHRVPLDLKDRIACSSIRLIRSMFDRLTGYNEQKMTEEQWLNRCIFLETVAGVPGMVGGMTRHL